MAGIAAGADGVIVEVHPDPDHATSDGEQSLTFDQFARLMKRMDAIAQAVDRSI